jgi:predicted transcriptional regulator
MLSIKKYSKLLKEIEKEPKTFTELVGKLSIPKGTLSKSLTQLRTNWLVLCKDKKYYLTMSGRYLLNIYKKIEAKHDIN